MMLRNKLAVPLHSQLALTIGEQALRAGESPPHTLDQVALTTLRA
jgi:hypothetical protein